MKKAVIFARAYNIHGQIEFCREYAEKKGYTVACVIVGSGRDLPDILRGFGEKIDLVIVRDMARISRNALESYTIQSELELDCGALVEDASERPKDDAAEKFMRNIIRAVQEEERREMLKMKFELLQ